jgi:hypothetical protein
MARRNTISRARQIYEWERGFIANIGVVSPLPYDIFFNHVREKNILEIVGQFFDNSTKSVDLLDLCVLEQFWWTNPYLIRAQYSKIKHPVHYSGEYVFDGSNGERTIVEVRQPDIDGKHWRADHVHIKRGSSDPEDVLCIKRLTFNKHIELKRSVIQGVYIMKVPAVDAHSNQ